jgi:benzoyl-CoA reductase/2-hydroxyglutaryl-CoA dehydratase subunit BcrC/BadD/HgdB
LPLLGALWQIAPQRYAALASAAADTLAARPALTGPRVLLAGTPADSAALHAALESAGAIVVAEASPFGAGAAGRDVGAAADPFAAIAARYRASALDARTPVAATLRFVEELLPNVDAVVISLPPDDASFGWDYPRLRLLLERRAVPHVVLEHDPARELPPAARGRVETLLGGAAARREARYG